MFTDPVSTDPDIQGGTACFTGTRVPVAVLFDHLEQGLTVDEFLADFPTVTHDQAIALLELAKADLSHPAPPVAR